VTGPEGAIAPEPASPPGGAPPGESFAEALATAAGGPPGSGARSDTRTADAEGAKAESDSPGHEDEKGATTAVPPADVALALAASSAVAAPLQPQAPDVGAAQPGQVVPPSTGPAADPGEQPPGPAAALAGETPIAATVREAATAPVQDPTAPAAPQPAAAPATPQPAASGADPAPPHATHAAPKPAAAPPLPTAPAPTAQADIEADAAQVPPRAPASAGQLPQPTAPQPADNDQTVAAPTTLAPAAARVETAPATSPVAPSPPPSAAPVRLSELAHATQVAIRFTAGQGGGSARILLHPQELGAVEIHLHSGPDGISATVRADNPQAAQTLMLASDELRRSLEAQGLPVLNLDVTDGSRRQAAQDDREAAARRRLAAEPGAEEDDPVTTAGVRLPEAGSQIDVLA
jgi:Meckel syndrome type 1 protein